MLRTTHAVKLIGTDYVPVLVEAEASKGIGIHLVGLTDAAVKESLLRTVTAMQACGYRIPGQKLVINLAPADLAKSGCGYDLAIALSTLAATGQEEMPELERFLVWGELGLDGAVRDVPGCVQALEAAKEAGLKGLLVPEGHAQEIAGLDHGKVAVYAVSRLMDAVKVIRGEGDIKECLAVEVHKRRTKRARESREVEAWTLLKGNEGARRAAVIAAAGGHNILFVGVPGSGKAMAAKAVQELLPPMTAEESLQVAKAYSATWRLHEGRKRPFRAPRVSCSMSAMLGGGSGSAILPGEVSLAHNGVLYLEHLVEAPKSLLEGLRGPLEEKEIVISRLNARVHIPADFILAAGILPCPCGYYGEGDRCTCTPAQRAAYLSRLTPAIMDHIAIQAYVRPVTADAEIPEGMSLDEARESVRKTREAQMRRFEGKPYRLNDEIPAGDIDSACGLDEEKKTFLDALCFRLGLSARAYTRMARIARTIADLDGSDGVETRHLAEAASYRFLDRMTCQEEAS